MNTFDEVEIEIINTLDNFLIEAQENKYRGNKIWTRRIKELLAGLGKALGYQVAVGGFRNQYEAEWLYDIVWFVEDNERRLLKIPLIVESEWDMQYTGIKYDFEKLLAGNAERRLFICQAWAKDIEPLQAKLKDAVDVFQENEGDRFLIAILDATTESRFHYGSFVKTSEKELQKEIQAQ